ncbi:MAG: glucokinase [Alphaproteobacteria bacterium]|nr:glucokinase [Alphaproteobacteria bacterium]
MFVVADIGGTYVRFAQVVQGAISNIQKYEVDEFATFNAALAAYCTLHNADSAGRLRIATAGYEDEGLWKFVNNNPWHIDPQSLKDAGWDIEIILNDFEAATWSLAALDDEDYETVKDAKGASDTQCLIGPGTGLGLAYLHKKAGFVQKTHGGHMPAPAMSEEQWIVIQAVRRNHPDKAVVYENLVSGPGLLNIYNAICLMKGLEPVAKTPEDLLDHLEREHAQSAIRLFHEFFGHFAATVVVTGNAYGGLFITGGVVQRLHDAGVFDIEAFKNAFHIEAVDSVKRDLEATPISILKDPYPALKGILHAE